MSFEGEFASYKPLRRVLNSAKIRALQNHMRIHKLEETLDTLGEIFMHERDLPKSKVQPDLVLTIDGSCHMAEVVNGFPDAGFGYVTIASVLIDLKLVAQLQKDDFIDLKKSRGTEKASTIESVFPGRNITLDSEECAKSSLRRTLFEELKCNVTFSEGESLLDTYEHLFRTKRERSPGRNLLHSPIGGVDEDMTYGYGEYNCLYSGEPLFSTDVLRLHELMNLGGSSGELFGQVVSTFEELWLVYISRSFEKKGWLGTLRHAAFVMDGPLAVFSTSSWLTKVIEVELERIDDLQRRINGDDLLIVGLEESGTFFSHFTDIDTGKGGVIDEFPKQFGLLLTDHYIKRNIIFSESAKPYGQDTYFGRKLLYKVKSGQKLVPVIAWFNETQKDTATASINQFTRLGDVMSLLDQLISNRYPNSISPLVSAHAEAAIPLNLGKRIFEDITREIRERAEE